MLNTISANMRTEELLKQSQALTEELQSQQRELTNTNKRLEEQARTLRASEERLREQQEELQQTNEELEEKAQLLAAQKSEVETKNYEVEQAKRLLEEKAEQLALTSKYKSEFLANMSHELRTPLNSMLILSKLLAENAEDNLTTKQVEFSQTIHSSGSELLELINDILDLSKIESGTMTVDLSAVNFGDLKDQVERGFRHVATTRGLDFRIALDTQLPREIKTDSKRLQQVIKNLLSNAFKFTERGAVELKVDSPKSGWSRDHSVLSRSENIVSFSVTDTGIGIPSEKQQIIFEAFQQADGTTSRKYGGTGLGLSISREIAKLLGGEIKLHSEPGKGSTFTLFLPVDYVAPVPRANPTFHALQAPAMRQPPQLMPVVIERAESVVVPDDRETIRPGDQTLLVIEDDANFAGVLGHLAHERGFKVLVATEGEHGLALARSFRPDAITLDVRLPDTDGWKVLDRLKHDASTRHIPVHVISATEERHRALKAGAIAYLQKPAEREAIDSALASIKAFTDRKVKRLLLVEDDDVQRMSTMELIGNGDVETIAVPTGAEALERLKTEQFDCMVLDLGLPDMTGFELIDRIKSELKLEELPIVVYTGKDLSTQEETDLRRRAESIIVKDVKSPERLLDETALFLHRVEANLPEAKRRMLERIHQKDPVLASRKVLVIDDDVRNIFAITSMLERQDMHVIYAENGRDGIATLEKNPDVELVLMDVMMPEMDGYDTTRAIRGRDPWRALPIIALTAKAMKGDREKCIEAGASDYITKPIDTDQLLSLLRVWLYR